ncbi:MAG: aminoacetone oxidase family FAD-binding enzyme [Rikenellaceae bacterium]
MKIAIIGGGAAGYFAAINIKERAAEAEVTIFEASSKSLTKVGISGGGRCNLTNTFAQISNLSKAYPRGDKLIKRAFKIFDNHATVEWFEGHGVRLTTQEDECLFPASQRSSEIIETFVRLNRELGVEVKHSHRVERITPIEEGGYSLSFSDPKLTARDFDSVVVTTGGSPRLEGFGMLGGLNLTISPPLPSLFSLNIPNDPITHLMGCVVEGAIATLGGGSRLSASGAVLITHWGFSGPAILRLSSYGARLLAESEYRYPLSINWVGERSTERVTEEIRAIAREHSAKLVTTKRPYDLPSRLWLALLMKSGIAHERRFAELGSKGINRLVNTLTNDLYQIEGQSRWRSEFVTCGGVSLSSIDLVRCEAKEHPNLYFAGEVLDVDAITGGFNLQAAWSTAFCVACSITGRG